METIEIPFEVNGTSYVVKITDIEDYPRSHGMDMKLNYYVVPKIKSDEDDKQIQINLNTFYKQALSGYLEFRKNQYE